LLEPLKYSNADTTEGSDINYFKTGSQGVLDDLLKFVNNINGSVKICDIFDNLKKCLINKCDSTAECKFSQDISDKLANVIGQRSRINVKSVQFQTLAACVSLMLSSNPVSHAQSLLKMSQNEANDAQFKERHVIGTAGLT
jgi:hypothetical protein